MGIRSVMLFVFAIVLLACSKAFAQDYDIRLTREVKVGDEYETKKSGIISTQMSIKTLGQIIKYEITSFTVNLEGNVVVVEVDELNQAKKINLLVSTFAVYTNENREERSVLPKGSQIVAQSRNGYKEFIINGKKAPEDISNLLNILIKLPVSKITDDDIFGTKEKKKEGDRWAINSNKAGTGISLRGIQVNSNNIKGYTSLEKVIEADGVTCLKIRSEFNSINVIPPLPKFLAGKLKVRKSDIASTFSGEFPIDVSRQPVSEATTAYLEFVASGKPAPDEPEVTVLMVEEFSVNEKTRSHKRNDFSRNSSH